MEFVTKRCVVRHDSWLTNISQGMISRSRDPRTSILSRTFPGRLSELTGMIRLFLYIGFSEKHLKFDFVSRKFFMINYLYHIETLRMIWERLLDEIMRSFVDWIQLFMHLVSKSHVKFLNFRDKNGCANTGTSQTPISKIFVNSEILIKKFILVIYILIPISNNLLLK